MCLPQIGFVSDRKINLAILGAGWFGADLLLTNALASGHFNIGALCNVNQNAFQTSLDALVKAGQPKPTLFSDYKKMYALPGICFETIFTAGGAVRIRRNAAKASTRVP